MTNLEYIQEEEMIIDAIEHFKRIIEATTDTKEKYNEGFVDGLEFCVLHLSSILNIDSVRQEWRVKDENNRCR